MYDFIEIPNNAKISGKKVKIECRNSYERKHPNLDLYIIWFLNMCDFIKILNNAKG
jgi:hypothetical protein